MRTIAIAAAAVALAAAPVAAQQIDSAQANPAGQTPAAGQRTGPNIVPAGEPSLVFEREIFNYPGRARRDPFQPLTGQNAGPLFEDLRLRIILFMDDPNQSLVTLVDAANNTYRLRRGESAGNATVVDIGPTRVIFSVNDFGLRRQEVLELTATREGAGR